jgi:pimeloyl-ACP methyl ester carboxylesterase
LTDWVLEAPTGTFVLARGAGHYLHRDDPALVVAVVRDIVEKASAP